MLGHVPRGGLFLDRTVNRRAEVIRRLGGAVCDACDAVLDDDDDLKLVHASAEEQAFFQRHFRRRFPRRGVPGTQGSLFAACSECRAGWYDAVRDEAERIGRERARAQRANDWSVNKIVEPNRPAYVAAVREHRQEIKDAARSWRMGGGIFGGSDD